MQKQLYIAVKTILEAVTGIKYVALWNNQFERENENVSFNYPCCFIEFDNIGYSELLKGVQNVDMSVKIHLGFESYKTEDLDILDLKQSIYQALHTLSFQDSNGTTSKLLRRAETQNFDHTNIHEYILEFVCGGKDYSLQLEPKATVTVDDLVITATFVAPSAI
jgi:hypothetical protein